MIALAPRSSGWSRRYGSSVIVWPVALFALGCPDRAASRGVLGRVQPVVPAVVVAALAYPATTLFLPGRIDSSRAAIVLAAAAVLAAARRPIGGGRARRCSSPVGAASVWRRAANRGDRWLALVDWSRPRARGERGLGLALAALALLAAATAPHRLMGVAIDDAPPRRSAFWCPSPSCSPFWTARSRRAGGHRTVPALDRRAGGRPARCPAVAHSVGRGAFDPRRSRWLGIRALSEARRLWSAVRWRRAGRGVLAHAGVALAGWSRCAAPGGRDARRARGSPR